LNFLAGRSVYFGKCGRFLFQSAFRLNQQEENMSAQQKIMPCLWFDDNCEEAVNFYCSIFPGGKINTMLRHPEGVTEGPMKDMGGKVWTAIFELSGFTFQALDGGPMFKRNPSVSFFVNFDPSQNPNAAADIDTTWAALAEGGRVLMPLDAYDFAKRYGWVEDRFGISWQLILTDPEGDERPVIMPSLLFTEGMYGKAEEALNFYTGVFAGAGGGESKMGLVATYPAGMEPDREGAAMFAEAKLGGQWLVAMDSAREHGFRFTEALSLSVECADQAEVDHFWEQLSAVPEAEQCGWLKDKYGVSWQIVPKVLSQYMNDPDPAKVARVADAFMPMKKLEIAKLDAAYQGN
jgi:predicted 3-demethylubiquinone-9 3-methyltransferase (glyoxalase superfamily)